MAGVKGILFDLGDTLLDFGQVDTIELFEQGAHRAHDYLSELGLKMPEFHAYHRQQYRAVRWAYIKSRLTGREFNAMTLLSKLTEKTGHRLTDDQAAHLVWLWYEPLSKQATIEPELPDLLREWTDQGYKLGVVSNTFIPGEALDKHIEQVGLLHYLPERIYSCDVGRRKPHPSIFRIALKRLHLNPRETVFVGDSLPCDVRGANRMGMTSVLKDPTGDRHLRHIQPNYRIRRLAELREILNDQPG